MTVTPKSVYVKTYGCQMNVYDSERMRDTLKGMGYAETPVPDLADLVIFNTCHIREHAAEKVYSELGRMKRLKKAKAEFWRRDAGSSGGLRGASRRGGNHPPGQDR